MSTTETGLTAEAESGVARTRRAPGPVAWISVAWAGMLALFLLAAPIYQAPDENTHVDRVLSTATAGFPEHDELRYRPEVSASAPLMGLVAEPDPFDADNAPARPVPAFADLAGGPSDPNAVNQLAGHPPAYYALMGGARAMLTQLLPRDAWPLDRDVLLLRVLNVLLVVWLPVILARTARNLGMAPWQTWIAAALPLCIPQLAHIGASVNNDNLLIVASALATMLATDVLRNGLRWGPTLGMALAAAVGIQTKLFGWAVVPLVVVVCLTQLRGRPQLWPRVAAAAGIIAAASWTYLRNLALHGHPYPVQSPPSQPVAPEGFTFEPLPFLAHWAANTTQSFFGKFGWLWLPLPRPWTLLLSAALLACLAYAVLRPSRPGLRLALLPVAVITIFYLYTSYAVHLATGVYAAQQGRYLFPVIASLGVAVAAAAAAWPGRSRAGVAVAGVAGIGWLLSAWTLLTGFWAGAGFERLASLAAWSPIGSVGLVALGLAAAAFCIGVAAALRSGRALSVGD